MKYSLAGVLLLIYLIPLNTFSQDQQGSGVATIDKLTGFPAKFFNKMQDKTERLNDRLTRQTEKYLQKIAHREARLKKKLYKVDSTAAKKLFADVSQQQYAALAQKLKNDTGSRSLSAKGEYQSYADSLKNSLAFLEQNPQLLSKAGVNASVAGAAIPLQLKSSISQLQQLQTRMQDADQAKQFIQQRKEQIRQYLNQHSNLPGSLSKEYQDLNRDLYYYSQQVRACKETLNNPDEMEKKALSLLNRLPAFQSFMKNNSQLAGLFSVPGNYSDVQQSIAGLQTRDQVSQLIVNQLGGGPNAGQVFQQQVQSAEGQLSQLKDKLGQLGSGNGDMDMPDFKPNNQRTKTFLQRLEYATNLQTQRSGYFYPTTTDIALSAGYKLSDKSIIGIGSSFKLGLGTGIQHIQFSGEGLSLRTFADIRLKGSFYGSGGFEYNYQKPFTGLQQIDALSSWSQSGLAGVSKMVSLKSKLFKKTKLSLLWDFLSYSQRPVTQPVKFRVGYTF